MTPTHQPPVTPGEILVAEFLEPMGMTQQKLADLLKIPLQRINLIVNGRRGITAETALLLSQAFDTSAEFWLNLQNSVDLFEARRAAEMKPSKSGARRVARQPVPKASRLKTAKRGIHA